MLARAGGNVSYALAHAYLLCEVLAAAYSCPLSSPRLLVVQPTRDCLQDGRTVTAAVLVGADGNLSDVRRQLLDDGLPRFAGLAVWRAMRWGPCWQHSHLPH